jgi:hypothetical protein
MRLLLLIFVALASFGASAEAPPDGDAKAALVQAAKLAEAHADARYAFSVEYWRKQNDEETAVTVRFDPRLPEGARWRVVDGSTDDLDDQMKKQLSDLEKAERPDDALVYDRVGEMLGDTELIEETEEKAVFRGPFKGDRLPEDAVEATIVFNKASGHIEQIDAVAKKSFKPAPIAKIKSMRQRQVYAAPVGDGPALLSTSESAMAGKAMFKSFEAEVRQRFFDLERVDPAELASIQ